MRTACAGGVREEYAVKAMSLVVISNDERVHL